MQRKYGIILLLLIAILAHGVAAFGVARMVASQGRPYPAFSNDAIGYQTLGTNLYTKGIFSRSSEPPYIQESFRTPGYPVLIAVTLWATNSLAVVIALQCVVAGLIAFLLFRLAEEAGLGRWSWVVGALAIVEPASLFLSSVLLTETIFTALFLAALLAVVKKEMSPAFAGVLLGTATLVRPSGLLLLIPFTLWIMVSQSQKRFRNAGIFIVCWMAVVAPWVVRNGQMFGSYAVSDVIERKILLYDVPNYASHQLGRDSKEISEDVRIRILERTGKTPRELTLADRGAMRDITRSYIDSWPRFVLFNAQYIIPFFGANELNAIGEELGVVRGHERSLSSAVLSGDIENVAHSIVSAKWFVLEYLFWGSCLMLMFIGAYRSLWLRDRASSVRLLFFVIVCMTALGTGVVATYRLKYPVSGLFVMLAIGAVVAQQQGERKETWTRIDDLLRLLRLRKIKKYIPLHGVLVDLGCGHEAYMLKLFREQMKELWGYDKDIAEVDDGNLHIRAFSLQDTIPRADASTDAVTLCAALEHFPNDVAIVREARRILRPNGVLLVTVPSAYARPVLEALALLRIISPEEIHDHKRYYTPKILREVFLGAGFTSEEITTRYWQFGFNCFALAVKKDVASTTTHQTIV